MLKELATVPIVLAPVAEELMTDWEKLGDASIEENGEAREIDNPFFGIVGCDLRGDRPGDYALQLPPLAHLGALAALPRVHSAERGK